MIETFIQHAGFFAAVWFALFMEVTHFLKGNVVWVALSGVLYVLVNFLATELSGTPVYKILDFKTIYTAIYLGGAAVLVLIGHFLSCGISTLVQNCIRARYKKRREQMEFRGPLHDLNLDGGRDTKETQLGKVYA